MSNHFNISINNIGKLFILNNNYVLYQVNGHNYKIKLNKQEIGVLLNILREEQIVINDENKLIINKLRNAQLIRDNLEKEDVYKNTSLEKSIIYFIEKHGEEAYQMLETIKSKSVLLIGIGGVGGELIKHLVAFGVENFILIDPDTIHRSNLNRQFLYSIGDLGRKKVEIAEKFIKNNVTNANVITFCEKIDCEEKLENFLYNQKPSIIINTADTPPIISQIAVVKYAHKYRIPYISGGVGYDDLYWGPIIDSELKYKNYLSYLLKIKEKLIYSLVTMGSISFTNSLLVDFMASDIFYYLCEKKNKIKSKDNRVIYEVANGTFKMVKNY